MARDGWPERLQIESTHGAFIGPVRDALSTARAMLAFVLDLLPASEQSHASPFGPRRRWWLSTRFKDMDKEPHFAGRPGTRRVPATAEVEPPRLVAIWRNSGTTGR
jgi:hypothetical protein